MGAMEFAHIIFKQIMWRSSKKHVADELDLPSQEECLSWLTLSPVEEHFYQRQHETCVRDAHEIIESLTTDILNRKVPGLLTQCCEISFFNSFECNVHPRIGLNVKYFIWTPGSASSNGSSDPL